MTVLLDFVEPRITNVTVLNVLDQGIPKEAKDKKTWKGKVAKQWKKMQHSSGNQHAAYPHGGAIGTAILAYCSCPPHLVDPVALLTIAT